MNLHMFPQYTRVSRFKRVTNGRLSAGNLTSVGYNWHGHTVCQDFNAQPTVSRRWQRWKSCITSVTLRSILTLSCLCGLVVKCWWCMLCLNSHPATVLRPFFQDHASELVPEENFWTLWCKGRLTEADTPTIQLGATPYGLTSAHLHHLPFHSVTLQKRTAARPCRWGQGD